MTRLRFLTAALLAVFAGSALAQTTGQQGPSNTSTAQQTTDGGAPAGAEAGPNAGAEPVRIEFTQQADGLAFDGTTLTLNGTGALTLYRADQPQPMTGAIPTAEFVKLLAALGSADGPNALVLVAGSNEPPAVVEITGASLTGDALAYEVRVLEGTVPANAEDVALFIDPWIHVGPYRPYAWGPRVVYGPPVYYGPGPVVLAPRCHYSPYYYGRVCRVW